VSSDGNTDLESGKELRRYPCEVEGRWRQCSVEAFWYRHRKMMGSQMFMPQDATAIPARPTMPTALLLIDIQQGLFTPPLVPHHGDAVMARIAGLLDRARVQHVPIIHVQHDGGEGDPLAKGSPGWHHHLTAAPREGEPVIEKRHSSAFHDTKLHAMLSRLGIDHLVIAGLQTEYCVDSACRTAVALGYRVTLVEDGHTTFPVGPESSGR